MSIKDQAIRPNPLRPHVLIKPLGIGIRLNLHFAASQFCRCRNGVYKKRTTNSPAHRRRQYPQMQQLHPVSRAAQSIKASYAALRNGGVNLMAGDEFRCYGECVAPVLHPFFRITPVALGSESDIRQHRGIGWFGADNLHRLNPPRTNTPDPSPSNSGQSPLRPTHPRWSAPCSAAIPRSFPPPCPAR